MTQRWMKLGLAAMAAAVLSACGGGGGSAGDTQMRYSITLRADSTLLPINIAGAAAGTGAYSPYTTTLYVAAKEGNDAIQNGEETFSCNVAGGLNTGALYYLDGDDDHEDDDGNPVAYRSIVLGSNAGGNSFHFHAGNTAGLATVTCAVTDPRDSRVYTASVDITVGSATGRPASIQPKLQAPYYLGTATNENNVRNNVGLQVFVYDDANQLVPNPSAANVRVSVVGGDDYPAASGARLMVGSQSASTSSSWVDVTTVGGVAQLSLSSGNNVGTILLKMVTDRADNDVSNGIGDAVVQYVAVPVVKGIATEPLAIPEVSDLKATNGFYYVYALTAEGGVPPYRWTVEGLPKGLKHESGIISGTPDATAGDYRFVVRVADENGTTAQQVITLTLDGLTEEEKARAELIEAFSLNCTSLTGNLCVLPEATNGQLYQYTFSANSSGITWSFSGLPNWLSSTSKAPDLKGTPSYGRSEDLCPTSRFLVTATKDGTTLSVTRNAQIAVSGVSCQPLEEEDEEEESQIGVLWR